MPLLQENMENTQKRGRNFTERDKFKLLEIIEEFKEIIENKKTGAVFAKDKLTAWAAIAVKFNLTAVEPRTGQQLRALYDGIKRKVKKDVADDKVLYKLL